MAIILVTYDLKTPGQDYKPVHDYLKTFSWCKGLESVWLLDTNVPTKTIRVTLQGLVDGNDKLFVTRLSQDWSSYNYFCGDWLNDPARNW